MCKRSIIVLVRLGKIYGYDRESTWGVTTMNEQAVTANEKHCRKCGVSKPLAAFHAARRSADGVASWCKHCTRDCVTASRLNKKPKIAVAFGMKRCPGCKLELAAELFALDKSTKDSLNCYCKKCSTEISKRYYAKNRSEVLRRVRPVARRKMLKYVYGITEDDYSAMESACGGVCETCGSLGDGDYLCVDHCHATGIIRGLLCRKCNAALGLVNDSLATLNAMVSYLSKR